MTQTPAAWYPDPEQPGMQRYWDGTQWTEHRAPLHQPAQQTQPTQPTQQTWPAPAGQSEASGQYGQGDSSGQYGSTYPGDQTGSTYPGDQAGRSDSSGDQTGRTDSSGDPGWPAQPTGTGSSDTGSSDTGSSYASYGSATQEAAPAGTSSSAGASDWSTPTATEESRYPGDQPTTSFGAPAGDPAPAQSAEGPAAQEAPAGRWTARQTTPAYAAPTFLQIAAGCRDDATKEPLSRSVEGTVGPDEVDPVRRVFAEADTPITGAGARVEAPVRLVANPWNAGDPDAVAVLVGEHQVAFLPTEVAAEYRPALLALSQQRLLATGTATLRAEYDGSAVSATAALHLPEASALS